MEPYGWNNCTPTKVEPKNYRYDKEHKDKTKKNLKNVFKFIGFPMMCNICQHMQW